MGPDGEGNVSVVGRWRSPRRRLLRRSRRRGWWPSRGRAGWAASWPRRRALTGEQGGADVGRGARLPWDAPGRSRAVQHACCRPSWHVGASERERSGGSSGGAALSRLWPSRRRGSRRRSRTRRCRTSCRGGAPSEQEQQRRRGKHLSRERAELNARVVLRSGPIASFDYSKCHFNGRCRSVLGRGALSDPKDGEPEWIRSQPTQTPTGVCEEEEVRAKEVYKGLPAYMLEQDVCPP